VDTHYQRLDTLDERGAQPMATPVAGAARSARAKSASSLLGPPVQAAVRNITFRQTIHVLCWGLEAFFVFALGYAHHYLWFGRADFLGTIFPMSLAVLMVACVSRRLITSGEGHSLAVRPSAPGAAALGLSIAFMPLLVAQLLNNAEHIWWLLAWTATTIMLALATHLIIWTSGWSLSSGGVALFGRTEVAERLAASVGTLSRHPTVTLLPYSAAADGRAADLARLRGMVEDGRVESVVLVGIPEGELGKLLNQIADLPIGIYVSQDARATHAPIREVVEILPNLLVGPAGLTKRALDLLGAICALVLTSPLIALCAIAVKLESPGPAFFRQLRFGCGGRAIEIWKIRSMYVDQGDPTGEQRTLAADPRVTRIGRVIRRLSIDELPQLLNVLRGDMSLVGPRPHAVRMKVEGEYYHTAVESYPVRHRVKPGITGWAQVNGSRGEVDTLLKASRRIRLDLWYISNWSPSLDLRILFLTVTGRFTTLKAD
jgi:exopolysaccharide biosynthesis polyprenyl glycosylphosphotransferase